MTFNCSRKFISNVFRCNCIIFKQFIVYLEKLIKQKKKLFKNGIGIIEETSRPTEAT
jgi:hypothetical protein